MSGTLVFLFCPFGILIYYHEAPTVYFIPGLFFNSLEKQNMGLCPEGPDTLFSLLSYFLIPIITIAVGSIISIGLGLKATFVMAVGAYMSLLTRYLDPLRSLFV